MSETVLVQLRKFLVESNAIALAIGVVIGGAVSKLVSTLVSGLFMPVLSLLLPGGAWRTWQIGLGGAGNALAVGEVIDASVDFLIISFVVFFLATRILRVTPAK